MRRTWLAHPGDWTTLHRFLRKQSPHKVQGMHQFGWGRPHHVECLNQNTSPKTTALTAQALNSFSHGKTKRSKLFMQHALCCVSFLLALPSWQWQRKTKMNSHPFPSNCCSNSKWWIHSGWIHRHSKSSQTSHNFQKHSSRPQTC